MKKMLLVIISLAVILMVTGCSNPEEGSLPGNSAPDFQLKSLDGRSIVLSELRDRPVMITFWTTWCGPCKHEMPLVQEIYEDKKWSDKGLVILAIDGAESESTVKKYLEDMGITFTVMIDPDNKVFLDYNIRAIPTTFFVDKNGIIDNVAMGAFVTKEQIEEKLNQIAE